MRVIGRAEAPPVIVGRVRRLRLWARAALLPVRDRASATDLAMLAMDTGPVPQQFAAILLLDAGASVDLASVERLMAERVATVPRLRQRLLRVPPGCGRPVWVDDPGFDIRRHVRQVRCRSLGDEPALLDTAAALITERLPLSRPPWSAVLVTGLAGDAAALVIVVHHVLADGIGGLAILASLADHAPRRPGAEFPSRAPSTARLAVDALAGRLRALSRAPAAWRALRTSISASGGLAPARAAPCSLIQPTGPRRRFAVVRADLAALHTAAQRPRGYRRRRTDRGRRRAAPGTHRPGPVHRPDRRRGTGGRTPLGERRPVGQPGRPHARDRPGDRCTGTAAASGRGRRTGR